ncbi:MAG TPA: rhodanese-like domain-containing protein [Marmoricola sp.]|jgi:rhodanese-related sulfurtransferase|nr:rhodanese-like domain-containing protein [Marmoricola sp.]
MTMTATINEMAAAWADGATIVDVREPDEYAGGHVPGALLMPVSHVPARVAELDQARPVYVICRSGQRSLGISEYLRSRGFDARSVEGGTVAWSDSGRPVVTGERASVA